MDTMKSLLTFPQKLLIKEYNAISETTFLNLLKSNSLLGLFFSAQWCPPCVQFTPILLDFFTRSIRTKSRLKSFSSPTTKKKKNSMNTIKTCHGQPFLTISMTVKI